MHEKFLKLEIYRSFSKINKYVRKLESYEYYSDSPTQFIGILKEVVLNLEKYFSKIPETKKFQQSLLQTLNYSFIPILRYIHRSQTRSIPWSLIPNIEQIIKKLLGEEYLILIRPQWHWNFSLLIQDLNTFYKDIFNYYMKDNTLYVNSKHIHVISFPNLERNNFLIHTVIGHEIGHFVQQKFFLDQLTDEWELNLVNQLRKEIEINNSAESDDKNLLKKFVQRSEEIILILKGLLREIIPDIIGYYLLGPSILFALYTFTFWNNDNDLPQKENNHYPSLKFRIRIIYEWFFKLDFENLLQSSSDSDVLQELIDFNNEIKSYLSDNQDKLKLESDPNAKIALKLFIERKDNIVTYCDSNINGQKYELNNKRISDLVDRITEKLPPNELDDNPVQLSEIFLSGWIYYYKYLKEMNLSEEKYVKEYEILSKLLLKASSLVYIHSHYLEKKNANP